MISLLVFTTILAQSAGHTFLLFGGVSGALPFLLASWLTLLLAFGFSRNERDVRQIVIGMWIMIGLLGASLTLTIVFGDPARLPLAMLFGLLLPLVSKLQDKQA